MGLKKWVHGLRNHSRFFTCHLSFIPRCNFVYAVFLCRFYIHASEFLHFVYLEQWLSREELCCSEMMQLFVIVLEMNEISLII